MLKKEGINTLYLLPITKTGKLKALGSAGSLYALDSFVELNSQLDDITDSRTIKEQAKEQNCRFLPQEKPEHHKIFVMHGLPALPENMFVWFGLAMMITVR